MLRIALIFLCPLIGLAGCSPATQEFEKVVENQPGENVQNSADYANLKYVSSGVEHYEATGRVTVQIDSAWDDDDTLVVRATFTPGDTGFHLYSTSLPLEGLEGLGRPTLVEVSEPERFSEVGELTADKTTVDLAQETLNLTFPVYPDGPVTLYLPLRFRSADDAANPVSLKLTYMACSDQTCHRPVTGAEVQVIAPERPGS